MHPHASVKNVVAVVGGPEMDDSEAPEAAGRVLEVLKHKLATVTGPRYCDSTPMGNVGFPHGIGGSVAPFPVSVPSGSGAGESSLFGAASGDAAAQSGPREVAAPDEHGGIAVEEPRLLSFHRPLLSDQKSNGSNGLYGLCDKTALKTTWFHRPLLSDQKSNGSNGL